MNTTAQMLDTQTVVTRRPYFSAISWGAIFAGIIVGLSINLVLNLLGVAAGLMTVDITRASGSIDNGPVIAAIWNGVSMMLASFTGAYVAARMSGLKRKSDGVLHGFVSWAATTILLTGLLAAAVGTLSNQFFGGVGRGIAQGAGMSLQSGQGDFARQLQALMRGSNAVAGNNMDVRRLQELQHSIQNGSRQDAIELLVNRAGLDQQHASTVVDQLMILSGSPEAASSESVAATNHAVQTAGGVTWGIIATIVLSLGLGLLGGGAGAAASRRLPQQLRTSTTVIR